MRLTARSRLPGGVVAGRTARRVATLETLANRCIREPPGRGQPSRYSKRTFAIMLHCQFPPFDGAFQVNIMTSKVSS